MNSLTARPFHPEAGVRWLARLLAVFILGLVLLFLVGEGFNPLRLSPTEAVQMTFHFTTYAGMVIAFRREILGGAIATAGMVLFFATEYLLTGSLPHGWVFPLMLLPGTLF